MAKIILLTHAPGGALGDPSSCAKLARLLVDKFNAQDQELTIKTVVTCDESFFAKVVALFEPDLNVEVVSDESNTIDKIKEADLIIAYPTPHQLSKGLKRDIYQEGLALLSASEYDFDVDCASSYQPVYGAPFLKTGLADSCLGVFCSSFTRPAIAPQDEAKLPSNLGKLPLYFGYFNRLRPSHSLATPLNFLLFAAATSTAPKIQIIMPLVVANDRRASQYSSDILLSEECLRALAPFKQAQISFCQHPDEQTQYYLYRCNDREITVVGQSKEEYLKSLPDSEKIIEIYNPFPLKPQTMQALFERSEQVTFITGDQSFSESLALHKIPFYQTMIWKRKFYQELIDRAEQFPHLHSWLNVIAQKDSFTINHVIQHFIQFQAELTDEIIALAKYIKTNFNLAERLSHTISDYLAMSPMKRFEFFMAQIKANPELYFTKSKESTASIEGPELELHLAMHLRNVDSETKITMLHYFYQQLDNISNLSRSQQLALMAEIMKKRPSLNFSLTVDELFKPSSDSSFSPLNYLHLIDFNQDNIRQLLIMYANKEVKASPNFGKANQKKQNSEHLAKLFKVILDKVNQQSVLTLFKLYFTTPVLIEGNTIDSLICEMSAIDRNQVLVNIMSDSMNKKQLFDLLFQQQHYPVLQKILSLPEHAEGQAQAFFMPTQVAFKPDAFCLLEVEDSESQQKVIDFIKAECEAAPNYKKQIAPYLPTYAQQLTHSPSMK